MTMVPNSPLVEEYSRKLESKLVWIFKFAGYLRFATKNGELVRKKASTSVLRCFITALLCNSSAVYVLYITYVKADYLILSEVGTVILFAVLQTCVLINIAGPNRNSGLILLKHCIKIDTILGGNETKFMREVVYKTYAFFTMIITVYQTIIGILVLLAYETTFVVYVVGTIYFTLLFLIFNDYCFLLTFYVFLALRVHYLNVAIIKRTGLSAEVFPKQFLFNGILWREEFDDLVTFHSFAATEEYVEAFKMIFKLLRQVEKCFRFTIFMGMSSVIIGNFLGVPAIIDLKNGYKDFSALRLVCVISWIILGWMYESFVSQQIDLFCRQIDKTKLLCTYVQLKPSSSDDILKLTGSILHTLEIRETQLTVYGMYFFNTSLVLRTAASIFVYITVQLQVLIFV